MSLAKIKPHLQTAGVVVLVLLVIKYALPADIKAKLV